MPGSPERTPSEAIVEFFDDSGREPCTAPEIVEETNQSRQTIQTELPKLAEQGLLQTKEIEGAGRVWWPARQDREESTKLEARRSHTDETTDRETRPSRQRLMENHRQLADLVTRLSITDDLDEILRVITEEARELVGAHQSVTSRTINQDWEQAINAVSLSEKYADYEDYEDEPDGSGIYTLVCERNEPMRLTQAELESHPAWNAFGDDEDEHPPMEGWLAVPIVGSDGQNMGLIQLSDKYRGDFSSADEAILVQLANVASAAIENAQLYDELRESEEGYRTLFDSMTEGYCVIKKVETAQAESSDFRYVEANPAFKEHCSRRDVIGKTVRDRVLGDPDDWLDVFEGVVQTGEVVTFRRELGSNERVLECRAFPIGDTPNRQVGMTVQDITERVERERRLKASNQRLESFASMLAHELRNPVAIGQIYSQQLPKKADSEAVTYVTEAFDRIEDMIDVMLVLTQGRNAIGENETLSLVETAREAWEEVDAPAATLVIDVEGQIETEGTYVRHLFRNLFENAVQHGGSDVTVRVGEVEDGFFVADDGVGIPSTDREDVFEAGMTTAADQGGTGLGLAFVQELAAVYDWSYLLTESRDGGARFEFANVDFVEDHP